MSANLTIELSAPCGHTLRPAPLQRTATIVIKRTCSRCRRRWMVNVSVLKAIDGGIVHKVRWHSNNGRTP